MPAPIPARGSTYSNLALSTRHAGGRDVLARSFLRLLGLGRHGSEDSLSEILKNDWQSGLTRGGGVGVGFASAVGAQAEESPRTCQVILRLF